MSPELVIRRAKADDVGEFNALVSSLGRVPLFRAIFGAFNYSNIVEFSHLSLLATCGSDKDSAVGFISMSDSLSLDTLSFESAVNELRRYIPLQVRHDLSFMLGSLICASFYPFSPYEYNESADDEHCLH